MNEFPLVALVQQPVCERKNFFFHAPHYSAWQLKSFLWFPVCTKSIHSTQSPTILSEQSPYPLPFIRRSQFICIFFPTPVMSVFIRDSDEDARGAETLVIIKLCCLDLCAPVCFGHLLKLPLD